MPAAPPLVSSRPAAPTRWWEHTSRLLQDAGRIAGRRPARVALAAVAGLLLLRLLQPFDAAGLVWFSSHQQAWAVTVARALSRWGELHLAPLVLVLVLGVLGRLTGRRAWAWAAGAGLLAAIAAGLTALVAKILLGRPRPRLGLPDALHGFNLHWDYHAFPSGHTAHWSALAVAIGLLAPRWGLALAPLVAAVAAGRLYLGAHYITDVTGGALLGAAVGAACGLAARRRVIGTAPSSRA